MNNHPTTPAPAEFAHLGSVDLHQQQPFQPAHHHHHPAAVIHRSSFDQQSHTPHNYYPQSEPFHYQHFQHYPHSDSDVSRPTTATDSRPTTAESMDTSSYTSDGGSSHYGHQSLYYANANHHHHRSVGPTRTGDYVDRQPDQRYFAEDKLYQYSAASDSSRPYPAMSLLSHRVEGMPRELDHGRRYEYSTSGRRYSEQPVSHLPPSHLDHPRQMMHRGSIDSNSSAYSFGDPQYLPSRHYSSNTKEGGGPTPPQQQQQQASSAPATASSALSQVQHSPPIQQDYSYPPQRDHQYPSSATLPSPSQEVFSRPASYPALTAGHNITYTDEAATKLSDRVRRQCYNCRTTDTSTWRRSNLHQGKVLCNKCGLFERTHSRSRPEQFPHRRPSVTTPPLPPSVEDHPYSTQNPLTTRPMSSSTAHFPDLGQRHGKSVVAKQLPPPLVPSSSSSSSVEHSQLLPPLTPTENSLWPPKVDIADIVDHKSTPRTLPRPPSSAIIEESASADSAAQLSRGPGPIRRVAPRIARRLSGMPALTKRQPGGLTTVDHRPPPVSVPSYAEEEKTIQAV